MSDFISKQGIKISEDYGATEDIAYLNRDEFIQIVTNLVRNSFQAILSQSDPAKRKKGKIQIKTASSNHLFTVDIVDNGPGVPEDKRKFVFDQGFTTKGPKEGTGLGLAICRRYARAFGGEVELLFSDPDDKGTCFRVTIPLKSDEAERLAS